MRLKLTIIAVFIAIFTQCILSCKKGNTNDMQMIQVDAQQNGKTIAVSKGQTIKITLGNPGDGGYSFNAPQYNSAVLSIGSHTRIPSTTGAVGDAGKDSWEFKALTSGQSDLTFTATRGNDASSAITIFSGKITVK
ncbi:MAG: protease inhibitor I42 family protein [Bacteroidota bacterium]|nr:protease inhibitor I42 family protein [Bacteroidota bacterium]